MVDLSDITNGATSVTDPRANVTQLLKNIAAILNNIPPSTDPSTQAGIGSLAQRLSTHSLTIAAAVVGNPLPTQQVPDGDRGVVYSRPTQPASSGGAPPAQPQARRQKK